MELHEPSDRQAAEDVAAGWPGSFWIPRRRVAARVELADGTTLDGVLYADVQHVDGTPATIADRLEDPLVRFLPLESDDQNCLLNKANIVSVELADDDGQSPAVPHAIERRVIVRLVQGQPLTASLFAPPWPLRFRVSDLLNSSPHQFLRFFHDKRLMLVNRDYVVAITEVQRG